MKNVEKSSCTVVHTREIMKAVSWLGANIAQQWSTCRRGWGAKEGSCIMRDRVVSQAVAKLFSLAQY
jgi:hypothetical protein